VQAKTVHFVTGNRDPDHNRVCRARTGKVQIPQFQASPAKHRVSLITGEGDGWHLGRIMTRWP